MKQNNWVKVSDRLPPQNKIVRTKIDEEGRVRNESRLMLKGTIWWTPDESVYVYFIPTHWLDE